MSQYSSFAVSDVGVVLVLVFCGFFCKDNGLNYVTGSLTSTSLLTFYFL